MALRLDNVGIVVEDLDVAIEFFRELGLELEGRGLVEGEWAGRVTGPGRPTGRDRHDAHTGRPRPARALALPRAGGGRRSPERPGERPGLPPSDVRRGRPRRHARPAGRARRAARQQRGGPVRERLPALLRPRAGRHSHRARPGTYLSPKLHGVVAAPSAAFGSRSAFAGGRNCTSAGRPNMSHNAGSATALCAGTNSPGTRTLAAVLHGL